MIIFGVYSKELDSIILRDGFCPACGTAITLTVSQRCFHIYGIPFFPLDKFAEGQCHRCRQRFEEREFADEAADEVKYVKKKTRTSLLLFTGPFLILFGILYYNVHLFMQRGQTSDYIADPKVRDLYILPISGHKSFPYLVCQVNAVTGDSVTMAIGTVGYQSESDAEKAIEMGKHELLRYFVEELTVPRVSIPEIAKNVEKDGEVLVVRPGE